MVGSLNRYSNQAPHEIWKQNKVPTKLNEVYIILLPNEKIAITSRSKAENFNQHNLQTAGQIGSREAAKRYPVQQNNEMLRKGVSKRQKLRISDLCYGNYIIAAEKT